VIRVLWTRSPSCQQTNSATAMKRTQSIDPNQQPGLIHSSSGHHRTPEGLIDWVKVSHPTRHKTGHFGDVLPSQSLGIVLKKLNLTQQKQTTEEQNSLSWTGKTHKMLYLNKCTKTKPKPKPTLSFNNCSCVCIPLCTTVVHNTAQNSSDNFPSCSPDNAHYSDDIYWRGGGWNQNWKTGCSLYTRSLMRTPTSLPTLTSMLRMQHQSTNDTLCSEMILKT